MAVAAGSAALRATGGAVSKRAVPAVAKIGRPTIRTDAMLNGILERLSQGEPLAQICREDGMPSVMTVWRWQQEDVELSVGIERAREAGGDQIALDALNIADDNSRDVILREDGTETPDHDHISRSKLRVETRLKLLAKWHPKRYGDRVALTDGDGKALAAPTTINVIGVAAVAKSKE